MSLKYSAKNKVRNYYIEQRYRARQLKVNSMVKFDDDVKDFEEKGYSFLEQISDKTYQAAMGFLFSLPVYWAVTQLHSNLSFGPVISTIISILVPIMIILSTNVPLLQKLDLERKYTVVNTYQFTTLLTLIAARYAIIDEQLIAYAIDGFSLLSLLFVLASLTNRFEEEIFEP